MKSIKVLQIASYDGNIGDMANHMGFRQSLNTNSEFCFEFDNLEIRNFYRNWNVMKFDDSFIDLANKYDLLMFGGGSFFQTNIMESSTGATIDLSENMLKKIRCPILFNCLGAGVKETSIRECEEKFKSFLQCITSSERCFVSVRNDNSYQRIGELYGGVLQGRIHKVPDGGFFFQPVRSKHAELDDNYTNIAINVACDQIGMRFPGGDKLTLEEFVTEFSEFCRRLLEERENVRLIFVPHIYTDYSIIFKILERLPDRLIRTRISCAAYLNGLHTDGGNNFDLYSKCSLVLGMRYHSNVVPIGMNVPTVGILNIEAHIKLYEDIKIPYRCIVSNEKGFTDALRHVVLKALEHPDVFRRENTLINTRMKEDNILYIRKIDKWLKELLNE